jgi:hypothetical protein
VKKLTKVEFCIAIALVSILGYYGWTMLRVAKTIKQRSQIEMATAASNHKLVFLSEAGIDVSGKFVFPLPPPGAERTIIFLLRGTSIKADLDFWRSVQSLLPRRAGLRLVGYCDGDNCADFVRNNPEQADFPVIAYGEIAGSQALVNEDEQGYSILRSERWFRSKHVKWRALEESPRSVVEEALR